MYPELNIHPIDNNQLSILLLDVDESLMPDFLEKLNVLRTYISDKFGDRYKFQIYANGLSYTKQIQDEYGFSVITISKTKDDVLAYAKDKNIDVIYSNDDDFILELYQGQHPYELTSKFAEVSLEIEAFLTGKDIAWSFNDAVWNATWLSKYTQSDALMQSVMKLLNKYQTVKGSTQKQIDFARALSNKAGHIRHCEEVLISLVQKKNYSHRNNSVVNAYGQNDYYDYKFEITFELGNFYFLISGTIDIIGRLLNKTYKLGDEKNIEREEFHTALASKNKELVDLYSGKAINEWIIFLKKRRNYVAHESNTTYSDFLKSKKDKTPQAEIDRIVEGLKDWAALAVFADPVRINYMKEDAKSVVRMYEDSTIITRDAMHIPWFNQETKEHEFRLLHPLISIRSDYDHIHELIEATVNILTK